MEKHTIVLRGDLIPNIPECVCPWKTSCSRCGKSCCECNASCIECEHSEHPEKSYGRSRLLEWFCPDCSYVVSLNERPDLGKHLWCTGCVKNESILDEQPPGDLEDN